MNLGIRHDRPLNQNDEKMKVFGIGLNKTGTTTLGKALEILGFQDHVSCRSDLVKVWSKGGDLSPVFQVADQSNNFEDWPWPLVYRELYERYDEARFILTLRDSAETWHRSLCKHARRKGPSENRKLIYGHYMPHDFKEADISFYNQHNESVRTFFAKNGPEKLLEVCWENGDGWEALCSFLEVEVPAQPFPRLNQAREEKTIRFFRDDPAWKSLIKTYLFKTINWIDRI
jgi:hypothetical protein